MNATLSLSRTAALVAGTLLALAGTARAADADAMPVFVDGNYIKISGVVPFSNGSSAAFNRRAQYSHDGAGGIEAASYSQELSKETSFTLDGKLLPGAGDYLGEFKVTKNEVGSFGAGYKRTRTFYDGVGGFFPLNNAWIGLYPRERYIDRSKFFAFATIELPKAPVFSFKYSNDLRNGTKDSTIWGDSDFTGIPIWSLSSLNPVTATRKLLPAYMQIGERQETWEASVRHTVGNISGSFALIGTRINNLDSRSVDRYTGELKPFPAIPSNPASLVPPALANNPNKGFDMMGFKESALTYLGKLEDKLSDRATLYVEANYRHATGDTTGSRLINAAAPTSFGTREGIGLYSTGGRPPYSYTSAGTLKTDTYTGVVGIRTVPAKDLNVDFAVRAEDYIIKADSAANYVANQLVVATGVVTPVPVSGANRLYTHEKPVTPAIDLRYTGVQRLALYAAWDYRTLKQDERTNYAGYTVSTSTGVLSAPVAIATDNIKEKHNNLKLGANWSPNAFFSLRPELFTKDHQNRFEGYGVSTGDLFVLDYDIYGARVTAIVKPLATLTFNTRYIVQRGKAAVTADVGKGDSNDSRRMQLCETIDWAPNKNFYLQGSVNLVYDSIRSAYPRVSGLAQTVIRNADNNYWNGSLVAAFAVDKQTDATVQGTYYKANNYNPAIAATTMPFGAGGKEYTLTLGVKHKFTDRVVGTAKVGYFESRNETMGGNADFHGPVAYFAMERAF